MKSSSRSLKGAIRMRSKALAATVCLLAICFAARAQESADRQMVVSLSEGGFVAFQSETAWGGAPKKGGQFFPRPPHLCPGPPPPEKPFIHPLFVAAPGPLSVSNFSLPFFL